MVRHMDSLRDRVVAQLREMILSNELPPGTKLRERTLSERLGVSRVPVREALMALESDLLAAPARLSPAAAARRARSRYSRSSAS